MNTASELLDSESMTESCQLPQFSLTCVSSSSPVQLENTEDLRTWLQGASRVSRFPQQASNWEPTIPATCGPQLSISSMQFDPDTASLKTSQLCLIPDILEPSSETWQKAGIVSDGRFYPQPNWMRRIGEIVYGLLPTATVNDSVHRTVFNPVITGNGTIRHKNKAGGQSRASLAQIANMWPTPNASDGTGGPGHSGREGGLNLRTAVKQWPTPRSGEAGDYQYSRGDKSKKVLTLSGAVKQYPTPTASMVTDGDMEQARYHSSKRPEYQEVNTGQLSPDWTEWLMGWPTGWTSLEPLTDIDEWLNETETGEWWQYEHDLPRVAQGVENRTHRLKAIGNGQVPVVVAMAWKILTQDLE